MKPKTMKRLLALPQEQQEKLRKLAMDRLKAQKTNRREMSGVQDKQSKK